MFNWHRTRRHCEHAGAAPAKKRPVKAANVLAASAMGLAAPSAQATVRPFSDGAVSTRRYEMLKLRSLGALALALLAAAATAANAGAWGTTGRANGSIVMCHTEVLRGVREIITPPPAIFAVELPSSYPNGTVIIGSTHPRQWVAYRARVYRVQNGVRVFYARGPWKATQVSDWGYNALGYWVLAGSRRRVVDDTTFTIARRGIYVVEFDVHWYADQYVGSGGVTLSPAWYRASDGRGYTEYRFGVY
jgi:hypothetical protein